MARRRLKVKIDMTPMVDVAFLLLIFFMSTTQFKPPEEIAVDLPASRSEIHVPDSGTITLTVSAEGRVFISSDGALDTQEIEPDDVLGAVLASRSRHPDAVVILKGDKDAAFGRISDVMDALTEARTYRFNLMTDLKRRSERGG